MINKVLKSDAEYKSALAELAQLVGEDPSPNTPIGKELELLGLLVETYEREQIEQTLPNPIEAIRFRMEQQNLSQRDLVPFIGSRSKVSEVLTGKRSLSLSMARALNEGLGIPAEVLLQESKLLEIDDSIDWAQFPAKVMSAREWISKDCLSRWQLTEKSLKEFFHGIGSPAQLVVLTRTDHIRSARTMDRHALAAWAKRIMNKAVEEPIKSTYKHGCLTPSFMRRLARLSAEKNGPIKARELLRDYGISMIVEQHLPRTYLDAAAIMVLKNRPIIGLTLRRDRIDNFWFSLMHEVAHISIHYKQKETLFFDDLEMEDGGDEREIEADKLASEALIPGKAWKGSAAFDLRSADAAKDLASELGIHAAIVAGRIRHKYRNYRVLNMLVGHGQVRRLFPEVEWR